LSRRACCASRAAAKRQRESPDRVAPNSEPTAEAGNVKPLKSKKNMKKTLRTMGLCALAALAVVSCKKNEEKVATTSFQATITQPTSNAKTHIGTIGTEKWLMWNTGDAIKVFDGNGTPATFTTNDNNAKVANFEGEIEASERYCAFYPAASASDASAGTVTLTLAATQTYKNGSFETNTYPMTATNNENSFAFSSPCGLLAIPVKGTGTLGSIELTSKTQNEMLAGTYAFNLADMSNEFTGNATTVTLNCEGGLTLSESEAATMVFVLPVGTLANGFTAVLKGTNGAELYRLETTNDNAIAADMIRDMPAVTVTGLPVNTTAATNVVYTTATLNGNCTVPMGMSVTEVGFYWGNATAMNNRVTASVGESFSYDLEGLAEGTEYAFQAFAKNGEQEYTGGVETFTTGVSVVLPTVTTAAATNVEPTTATVGGSITDDGGGTISAYGISYSTTDGFEGEDGTQVEGTDLSEGSFTANLSELSGKTTYYVRAYAINEAGTAYGEQVSFTTLQEGIVNSKAKFTINADGDQVYFSKGNLQYTISTQVWSFMENQYDIVETGGQNVGTDYANQDVVSHFGWATSGCDLRGTITNYYYQPYNTYYGTSSNSYGARYYGPNVEFASLTDDYANGDWGVYNAISNGGNVANQWRTPSADEWGYIILSRSDASSKYGHASIDGINGVILLPDAWELPAGLSFTSGSSTWANVYNLGQWEQMEAAGAVFLPAAGTRIGAAISTTYAVGKNGYYWSSSSGYSGYTFHGRHVTINPNGLFPYNHSVRSEGLSVRLVCPVE